MNFVKSFPTILKLIPQKRITEVQEIFSHSGAPKEISGNYTVEVNSSIILLPEDKMQARYFDPRVGFFAVGYTDFDINPQGVERVSLIKRWRLRAKTERCRKIQRGELVEPAKPIVFI